MPSRTKRVRFETEYNSSFKAFDPDIYKSPLISALVDDLPNRDQRNSKLDAKKTAAGLKSNKFLKSAEPPLQSKAKPDLPKTRLNDEGHNDDSKNESNFTQISKIEPKKNRALQFKAGLKHGNPSEQTKFPVSEYKREYDWKKTAIDDSPLLNAEKVVFDSHTNIPRFIREKVPRKTEYQSRFDGSVARKKNKESRYEEKDNATNAAERFLQTSQNPDSPFFPHGSNRVLHTEYQANFGSPKKYKYEEGMWLGAQPPHLLPDEQSSIGSDERITNWFEEVLELRAKAKRYKIRAIEGNYFSREFLAQLDAELEEIQLEQSASKHSKQKTSPRGELGRPRVTSAWAESVEDSEKSENDDVIHEGKEVFRDLNDQFRNVSVDNEAFSNQSEHGSRDSASKSKSSEKPSKQSQSHSRPEKTTFHENVNASCIKRDKRLISNERSFSEDSGNWELTNEKPSLSKTVKKHSSACHGTVKPATVKGDVPLMPNKCSTSEDSSNEQLTDKKPSLSKTAKKKHHSVLLETVKPAGIKEDSSILSFKDVSSNCEQSSLDNEATKFTRKLSLVTNQGPSSHSEQTMRQNALCRVSSGSDASSECSDVNPDAFDMKYIKNMHSNDAPSTSVRCNYGSDSDSCKSRSSLASRESIAQQTLAHARQRKAHFWK